jgi:hypothetical protein
MGYTVEIFTDDKAVHEIDTKAAEIGIDIVAKQSGVYPDDILTGNDIKITTKQSNEIWSKRIKWPTKLDADINIILTDRRLSSKATTTPENDMYGIAHHVGMARIAIVNTLQVEAVISEVVAHEIGHLVAVPTGEFNRRAHCPNQNCIMYKNVRTEQVVVPDTSNIYGTLRNLLRIPVMIETTQIHPQKEFCTNCTTILTAQLGKLSTEFAMQTLQNYKPSE